MSLTAWAISSLADRDLQPDRLGGIPQPLEVLVQPEDLAAVAPHAFEHAVAIEQPVVEDADRGIFLVEVVGR